MPVPISDLFRRNHDFPRYSEVAENLKESGRLMNTDIECMTGTAESGAGGLSPPVFAKFCKISLSTSNFGISMSPALTFQLAPHFQIHSQVYV